MGSGSGETVHILSGHDNGVKAMVLLPDGRRAISASRDAMIIWDLHSGEALRNICEYDQHVNSIAVTPDGRLAVTTL